MPWRMIRFLLIIAVVIVFIGLNAGNRSDISFWFNGKASFTDVPIYFSLFGAYVLGAVSVIPFALNSSMIKYKKRRKEKKIEKQLGKAQKKAVEIVKKEAIDEKNKA